MGSDTIGGRIADLRSDAGLSQERFAELIGKSRNAVKMIEHDESLPKADTLMSICEVLNTSADMILFGEPNKGKDDISQIGDRVNKLDPELREQFYGAVSVYLLGLENIQKTRK